MFFLRLLYSETLSVYNEFGIYRHCATLLSFGFGSIWKQWYIKTIESFPRQKTKQKLLKWTLNSYRYDESFETTHICIVYEFYLLPKNAYELKKKIVFNVVQITVFFVASTRCFQFMFSVDKAEVRIKAEDFEDDEKETNAHTYSR